MRAHRTFIIGLLLGVCGLIQADPGQAGRRVVVDLKPTAAEQLALGTALQRKMREARGEEERRRAGLVAAAHLEAIAHYWPDNRQVVVEAAIMLGGIYISIQRGHNAVEALSKGLEAARGSEAERRIVFDLIQALERTGRWDEGRELLEQYRAAELRSTDPLSEVILYRMAGFHAAAGQPHEAAGLYRHLGRRSDPSPADRAWYRILAFRQARSLSPADAAEDLREAARLLAAARAGARHASERERIATLEKVLKKEQGRPR